MTSTLRPLDEMLAQLLETWEQRYAFQFDREQRDIKFARGKMIARATEQPDGLIVVAYEWAPSEMEYEFCTPDQAAALIEAVLDRNELCLLPKYGKPPLLVLYFVRGPAQAVALEFHPENVDAFTVELPRAKVALRGWRLKHGAFCDTVLFTVVAGAEHHAAIETLVRQICRHDAEWVPLLKSLEVRLSFYIDARAKPVKEEVITVGSRPNADEKHT